MATSVGFQLEGGRIPGERIATHIETVDSDPITTTETVIMSVTASVVEGRIYKVRFAGAYNLSVADDVFQVRFREDSLAGPSIMFRRVQYSGTDHGFPLDVEVEYTADVTEDKTFVVTVIRDSGTGNFERSSQATLPAYFYVDYIRG